MQHDKKAAGKEAAARRQRPSTARRLLHIACSGAISLLVGLLIASAPSVASERDHGYAANLASTETSQLDPHTAEVAQRLWRDLVCLCGRCQRLTLSACHCPDAAAERKKVLDLLRGRDIVSRAGAEAAYQTVVKEYVARFGGRHVLASEQPGGPPADWPALAVSVAVIAAACAAVVIVELRRRSRRRSLPRYRP